MRLVNNHTQPITLDDGTVLAAAGTEGSERQVGSVSDRDRRRFIERGLVGVLPDAGREPAAAVDESGALGEKRRPGK